MCAPHVLRTLHAYRRIAQHTAPLCIHTTGPEEGQGPSFYYVYTESSSPNYPHVKFTLESPLFEAPVYTTTPTSSDPGGLRYEAPHHTAPHISYHSTPQNTTPHCTTSHVKQRITKYISYRTTPHHTPHSLRHNSYGVLLQYAGCDNGEPEPRSHIRTRRIRRSVQQNTVPCSHRVHSSGTHMSCVVHLVCNVRCCVP